MTYTVYALVEPVEHSEWKDIRYIGISKDVLYRFSQHLSCRRDDGNPEKNAWVQSILAQGLVPTLAKIEDVGTREKAREREQYWIRYAMEQGAYVLNLAITYTAEERAEVHRRRALHYAAVEKLLARGTYVKRSATDWYPSSLLERHLHRGYPYFHLDILDVYFVTSEGNEVSVGNASDAEFDAFIRQYIPVVDRGDKQWFVHERAVAVLFAWGSNTYPDLFMNEEELLPTAPLAHDISADAHTSAEEGILEWMQVSCLL